MKRYFCLKAKNGLGRFAPSVLPHYNDIPALPTHPVTTAVYLVNNKKYCFIFYLFYVVHIYIVTTPPPLTVVVVVVVVYVVFRLLRAYVLGESI